MAVSRIRVEDDMPYVKRVILLLPKTCNGPQLLIAISTKTEIKFHPSVRSDAVDRIVCHLLEAHSKARDDTLLDVHCFACNRHLCGHDPRHYVAILRRTEKCCDECHLDEGGATLFISIVCGDKVKCRKPIVFKRLDEWTNTYVRESAPGDEDAVAHLRICDWCHRAQFARNKDGQRIDPEDGSKLMQCSQCTKVYYCNATCQLKAWPRHKEHCTNARKD